MAIEKYQKLITNFKIDNETIEQIVIEHLKSLDPNLKISWATSSFSWNASNTKLTVSSETILKET